MADKGPHYYSSINVGGTDGHYYSSVAVGGEKTRASYPADKSQAYHNAAYSPTSSLGKDKYRSSGYEAQPQVFYQSSSPGKESKHRSPSHAAQQQALYPVVTPERDDKYRPTSYDAQAQAYYSAPYKGSSPKRRADKYKVGSDHDANDDFTCRVSKNRCYIILCVVVFLAALALGLGLGLYFGVFKKSESKGDAETTTESGQITTKAGQTTTESGLTTTESEQITTKAGQTTTGPGALTTMSGAAETTTASTPTTATPETTVSYEVDLTLDQDYTSDLDNPSSLVYTNLKNNVENLMNSIMGNSELSDYYNGSTVVGFSEGSTIANVATVFWESKTQIVEIDVAVVLTEVKKGFVREAAAVRQLNILEDQTKVELVTRSGTNVLGEACEDVSDCVKRHTDCSGWPTPICRCLTLYYSKYDTTTAEEECKPKIGVNKYGCTDKAQCTDSEAVCSNTKCVCPDTHRYDGNRCVKIKYLGEKCEQSVECSSMFQCKNKTCSCPDGQFADGATCRKEPVACDDQNILLAASIDCNINPLTLAQDIQSYTCRALTEKLNCIVDLVNADRPMVYDCNGTDIKDALLGSLQSQGVTTSFSIENCSEFKVKVVYNEETCVDKVVPVDVENDFKMNKLPVLFDGLEYSYIGARCNSYDFEVAVWFDKPQSDLESKLSSVIYSHELFVSDSLYATVEQASLGTDYCKNLPTLKQLGIGCIRGYVDKYWWSDWETCNPVIELGRCIGNEISSQITNKWCYENDIIELLFNDDTARQQFIDEATSKLTAADAMLRNGEQQMLQAVSRFSRQKCSVDRSENFPCDDYQQRVEVYNICKAKPIITSIFNIDSRLPNYGLSADNCRDFFHFVSCVTNEFSKLRVWCGGLEQFVYDNLKTELGVSSVLPTYYYELEFCAEHQPVCSSTFIHDAKDRCPMYGGYGYDSPDCTAEDIRKAVSYVTCVRLIALSSHQEDCTTTRIKEIINNDYFKLGVVYKFADIDKCIPDESIATVLPTRGSVCTSGIPIALYQGQCALFSQTPTTSSNYTNSLRIVGPCITRARDIARAGQVDLGCRLYLTEMSCVQTILANMSFDCSMSQLANSPVPSSSPLYIPTFKNACLDIYNNDDYQTCDAGLLRSSHAGSCSMGRIDLPDAYISNQQRFCAIHQESLGCYYLAAQSEGLVCANTWLNRFLTSVAVLQRYARRPEAECNSPPDTSDYDACPVVIPQGSLCTDHDRVTNLVAGVCSVVTSRDFTQINTTQQIDDNVINCRRLSDMLWCGTNVTQLGGENCTLQQVSDAVFARQNIIAATIPNFQINVCQDDCYQFEAVENTCVTQQLYAWGIDDCRLLSYMWSCLDSQLKSNTGSHCAHSIIRSVIAMATARYHMRQDILDKCPDPSLEPLDVCTNPADIASLGGYSCSAYLYNMSSRNCMDGDKARTCYRNVIDKLGGSCTDMEKLIEETMLLAGFINGYDITRCVGQNYRRTGFCPFSYSNYCGGGHLGTDACVLDTDCGDDLKCCYHSCNTTCRAPLTDPARWYGELSIKNETFESSMEIKDSLAYQNFLQRYSDLISVVLGQFHHYEIEKLSPGVVISFHVWSSQDPRTRMENALHMLYPDYHLVMEIGKVRRDEIDRLGECPYSDAMGTACGEVCEYDADCPGSTAKCCYNPNCGEYGDSRCYDQGISSEKGYDCKDILERGFGSADGVYEIQLKNNGETIQVYCDMTTDGGGWTVFQRRFDGSVDFYRNKYDYENGFGSKDGEFWLGLKYVYNLTYGIASDMRLDLENAAGETIYEIDNGFRLTEAPYYKLYIDGYWISAGVWDPVGLNIGVGYYNGNPFSTYDADYSNYDCPVQSHGAFWYAACSDVNPNGEYVTPGTERQGGGQSRYGGIIYHQWMGFESLKSTKMMIRRT